MPLESSSNHEFPSLAESLEPRSSIPPRLPNGPSIITAQGYGLSLQEPGAPPQPPGLSNGARGHDGGDDRESSSGSAGNAPPRARDDRESRHSTAVVGAPAMDDETLSVLREKLITTLGVDMSRGLLTGWGYELGRRDALALAHPFSWEDDAGLLLASPRLLAWQRGTMEPRRVGLSRARGHVDIEVLWRRSTEAEHYLSRLGRADHAVCWMLSGYYAGYAGTLLARPISVVETTCAGMGAEHCTLRLRAREPGDQSRPAHAVLEQGHAVRVMHSELERLRFESSMRLTRLEALREAVLDVTAELRLSGVQAKIVSRGRVLLGARYAFLVMYAGAPGQGSLGYDVVHDGLAPEDAEALDPFPVHDGLFAEVLQNNDTVRVRRAAEDPRARGLRDHQSLSASFLGVPLRIHSQQSGALYFADRLDGGEFSLDDQKLAESFAVHAGVALENARLVETIAADRDERSQALEREQEVTTELHDLRQELDRERQLLRALVDLPALPDLDSALHHLLSRIMKLLAADVGAVLLCAPGAAPLTLDVHAALAATAAGGERGVLPIPTPDLPIRGGLAGRVLTARELVYVRDVAEDDEALGLHLRARGVRSLLGAPLLIEGRSIGVVEVGTYAVRTFDDPEKRFLKAAASQTALAIEHARAQQEVARFGELLQAVIEAAPIGMAVQLPGGAQTLLSNGVMRRLEEIGERCGVSPAGDAPQRALRGEVVPREERTLPSPEPSEPGAQPVALRVSAAPVRDAQGAVRAAVTVVEELTLEKELERLRERFVSLVAHDLKNPLSAAMMHLELLQERLEEGKGNLDTRGAPARLVEDSLRTSDAIHRAMLRVSDMVSDLLDYSRLEARQLTVTPSEVILPALVRELLEEQRPLLQGRMVEVDIDDDVPPLRADRRRLMQVLANLLGNAVKYTPKEVRLGLRARRASAAAGQLPLHLLSNRGDAAALATSDRGALSVLTIDRRGATSQRGAETDDERVTLEELDGWVLLTAWDQGPGIPAESRARLFDPFYRLSRDHEAREGTGLGLYITRGLCEAHGGVIWIDEIPGASFSMLWPVA